MFAKSKQSAVLMACSFGLPMAAVAIVAGQIRYSLLPSAEQNPNVVNGFAGIVPGLSAIVILFFSLGIASLVIYRLNDSHYGLQGAIRWAVAGTIYGLLQQVVLMPIPSDFDFQVAAILKQIGGDLGWKILTLVLVYLLVFPILSFVQNWVRKAYQGGDLDDEMKTPDPLKTGQMIEIRAPKMADALGQVKIVQWLVAVGDPVKRSTLILKGETEKVTFELEAPVTGTIHELLVKEGASVTAGTVLALIRPSSID